MAIANYRGIELKTVGDSTDVWQASIKGKVLSGSMAAIKKSIDWWCETASIIDPKEFASIATKHESGGGMQEQFAGFTLKNDTGNPSDWYCMFNGRLMKGSKLGIQKHIEKTIIEFRQANQGKKE